jgi:protein CpxP
MKKIATMILMSVFLFQGAIAQQAKPMQSHPKQMKTPEERAKMRSEMMQKNFGLTDDQKGKVYSLILKNEGEVKAVREKHAGEKDRTAAKQEMKALNESSDKEMQTILTPEQYAKWKSNMREKQGAQKEQLNKNAPQPQPQK